MEFLGNLIGILLLLNTPLCLTQNRPFTKQLVLDRRVKVFQAKSELRRDKFQKTERMYSGSSSHGVATKTFELFTNSFVDTLDLAVLLVDKCILSTSSVEYWLLENKLETRECGSYAVMVLCDNMGSFNRLLKLGKKSGHFLDIFPMAKRKGCYSRFIWLQIRGVPFSLASSDHTRLIAQGLGKVHCLASCSAKMKKVESLFAFIETSSPK